MSSAPTFAELLDAALAADTGVDVAPGAATPSFRETILFGFYTAPRAARPLTSVKTAAPVASKRPPAAPQPRPHPSRRLTAEQREALAALVSLGARLEVTFTARELRSAFKSLARQYHPDRHQGSSAAELARLTRLFAAINAHYQCLMKTVSSGERTMG